MDRVGASETGNDAFVFSHQDDAVASKLLEQTEFVEWNSIKPKVEETTPKVKLPAPTTAEPSELVIPPVSQPQPKEITLPENADLKEITLPETTARVEDLGKWFLRFGDIYDTNGDGSLESKEIDTALSNAEKSPLVRDDKLYLESKAEEKFYLEVMSNGFYAVESSFNDEYGEVTKKDLETFSKWIELYENDLERLKEVAPDKYRDVNFLRNEFKQLDADGDGQITLPEIEQYADRDDLTDDQKKNAEALKGTEFYKIAFIDYSIRDQFFETFMVNKLFGKVPAITIDRYTTYMDQAVPKTWYSFFNNGRQLAYRTIDDMRINKGRGLIFWGSPEDYAPENSAP